jgi:hypothetical protein
MQLFTRYKSISCEIYFWLLTILAMALPFSPFIISLCQILLFINWIAEGHFEEKFKKLRFRKSIWIFLLIYAVHIIWLIGSSDLDSAMGTLKIKLPLLILPLIIATSEPLEAPKIYLLLKLFIASVFVATIFGAIVYFGLTSYHIKDISDISVFISHIRLSLLVVISILTLLHWIKTKGGIVNKTQIGYTLLVIWLLCFLILLKSLTGLAILSVTTFILILGFVNKIENQFLKVGLIILMYTIPFISIILVINAHTNYYDVKKIDKSQLALYTVNGNAYLHKTDDWQIENGNKVWINVCPNELKTEWNKRSKIKYDSLDLKGQAIYQTIVRYMTSKGISKDSLGVTQLTAKDIVNIEHGLGNVIYEKKWSLNSKLYEVIWEIDNYKNAQSTDQHSFYLRITHIKIAAEIIKKSPLFGVGTGDLPKEYFKYYETHDTGLDRDKWSQIHNQFFTLLASFGLIGFILILFAFIYPPILERKWSSYYFVMIFAVIFLSFINDNTLETQIGVTFAAYFYSLFLWGSSRKLY